MTTTQPSQVQVETTSRDRSRVFDLLKEFPVVTFSVFDPRAIVPELHSRSMSMSVAKLDDDCVLWFVTDIESAKVGEAMRHQVGNVIARARAKQLTMSGSFRIVRDIARISDVWTKAIEAYFPNGPADPKVCLLGFRPFVIEYWDESGGEGCSIWSTWRKPCALRRLPMPATVSSAAPPLR